MAGSAIARTFRRHLVPGFVVSAVHLLRSRAFINASAKIQFSDDISFGRGTVVKAYVVVQSSGGKVSFGRQCALSSFNHFSTGEGDIRVGNYVRFGPNCTIIGGTKAVRDRNRLIIEQSEISPNGVEIGDDVLIGAGSVILPASKIGRGAVVGAGSVVQGAIPEYTIVAGSPAREVGRRE